MSATIFIDNKYTRIYYSIIERSQSRILSDDVYTERHHVIPRSLGGGESKSNLAILTAREHYICHWLLVKMTEGKAKRSMGHALRMMLAKNKHTNGRYIPKSKLYDLVKKTANEASKGRPCSPETREKIRQGNLNRGPASEETRQKLSEAAKRRKGFTPEGRVRVVEANKFRIWTDEAKQKLREARARQVERQGDTMTKEARAKLSLAAKGKVLADDHKEKIAAANRGKTRSREVRQAISERMIGHVKSKETIEKLRAKSSKLPKPQITCPHCGKAGGEPSMKRWHMDNCKHK